MKIFAFLLYALGGYVIGQMSLMYLMGFFVDVGVPKSISAAGTDKAGDLHMAIAINIGLVFAFGLHHSLTARASFKRWWTQFVPAPIERATYLYMTAAMTFALVYFWQPISVTLWKFESPESITTIYVMYGFLWLMMLLATFQFGHFGFFGLAQAWENFRNSVPQKPNLAIGLIYALVRHPISLGWMLLPWLTPHLTLGHVVFSGAAIIYIIIATPFEEADLQEELGEGYLHYKERTPAYIPWTKRL
jgi:protein-S-isoprenylcysteine O-methyltransferase Ste14